MKELLRVPSLIPFGGMQPTIEVFRYHPQQHQWIEDFKSRRARFCVVPAGRRSGKTAIAKRLIAGEACGATSRNARYFIGAPTRMQVKRIYWQDMKALIPRGLMREISESDLRIELANGASIHLFGLEASTRIEGVPWDGCVLDEYAGVNEEAWPVSIRPSLAERQGWAMFIGVPRGRNHYYDLWVDSHETPEWGGYTWKSADILPAAEIASAERDLDPRTFRQEFEASFEEASGRVYYAFERDKDVHAFELPENIGTDNRPWRVGFDFNVHPMSAALGWQDDETGHVYVWRIYQLPSSNTDELGRQIMADIAEAPVRRTSVAPIAYPDPSGKSRHSSAPVGTSDHSILRDLGFEVCARSASPSVRNRINAVNTRFTTGDGRRRAHIHPRCQSLVRALDGLFYKPKSNEPDKASGHDHITDAVGYWWEFEFPVHGGQIETAKF